MEKCTLFLNKFYNKNLSVFLKIIFKCETHSYKLLYKDSSVTHEEICSASKRFSLTVSTLPIQGRP